MQELDAYIPMECRWALTHHTPLPDRTHGAVLFADISGSTSLTAALARELGPRRGAEELSRQFDRLFTVLITQVHRYGGSVTGFSGDGITCWFDQSSTPLQPAAWRATAAGLAMQSALTSFTAIKTPAGATFSLGIKVAIVVGPLRRFIIGNPALQRLESLAGATMNRLALAEQQAKQGEVVVDADIVAQFAGGLTVKEWRQAPTGERFASVGQLLMPIALSPWPDLPPLKPEAAQPWLLPPVFHRLQAGHSDFLAELRPVVAFFLKFSGIAFDEDDHAGTKLDAYITWVQAVLARFEGYLMHVTIGGKGSYFNAAFGALVAHEDDPERAIAAALALQAMPAELNFIQDIQIGIGQELGFVGAYGSADRRTYGILGNEINIAARLMSQAQPSEILVTSRVASAASRHYKFDTLAPITVKGIKELLTPSVVRGRLDSDANPQLRRPVLPNLVGRQAETTLLGEQLRTLSNGRSSSAIIEGEAGIGKSRLIAEVLVQAQTLKVRTLVGAGDAIEKSSAYHAWQPVLRSLLSLDWAPQEGDMRGREVARSQILAYLTALDATLVRLAPLFNALLPLDFPENELTIQMDGQVRADNTQALFVRLLQAAATTDPLLLILEDAHWLDSASWALVRLIKQAVHPLCLLITTRPLQTAPPVAYTALLAAVDNQFVRLNALAAQDVEALVCARLGVAALPEAVATLIRVKGEGHPFFSEELAYALRDAGLIQIGEGACRLTPGVGDLRMVDFPSTIEGVITSRIDRLAPEQQVTIKIASVIGRLFAYQLLYSIHPIKAETQHLRGQLITLEQLDLTLLDTPDPELAYLFRHTITQEVVYNLLLQQQRYQLHREIAQWYEHNHGHELAAFYPPLAYHYSRAIYDPAKQRELVEKASYYLEKAGEEARRGGAWREAIHFYTELLNLSLARASGIDQMTLAHWRQCLGHAYLMVGEIEQSKTQNQAALVLLGQALPTGRPQRGLALLSQVTRQALHRRWPGQFLRRAAKPQAALIAARAYEDLGNIYYHADDALTLLYVAIRNLNQAEQAPPSTELAQAYSSMSVVAGIATLHKLAQTYLHLAYATLDETIPLDTHGFVNELVSMYWIGVGRWEKAQQALTQGLQVFEKLGHRRRWREMMALLAYAQLSQGRLAECAALRAQSHEVAIRDGDVQTQGWAYMTRGEVVMLQGQLDEALSLLQHAVELGDKIDRTDLVLLYGDLAALYMRRGELGQAQAAAAKARAVLGNRQPASFYMVEPFSGLVETSMGHWTPGSPQHKAQEQLVKQDIQRLKRFARVFPIGQARLLLWEGLYTWRKAQPAKAIACWQRGLTAANALQMPYEAALLYAQWGLHAPLQDSVRVAHLQRAAALFEQIGAAYDLKRVQAALQPNSS